MPGSRLDQGDVNETKTGPKQDAISTRLGAATGDGMEHLQLVTWQLAGDRLLGPFRARVLAPDEGLTD